MPISALPEGMEQLAEEDSMGTRIHHQPLAAASQTQQGLFAFFHRTLRLKGLQIHHDI